MNPPSSPSTNSSSSVTSKSSAVKRLLKELAELQKDESITDFWAAPLESNILEWHFTIRGPQEGGFQGGRYHGRLIFPPDYPFKPPHIAFLHPNGRFEVNKKICLSITGHHPEFWRPAWGVRTALVALISFFPTKGDGAIAALDYTEEERTEIAKKSRKYQCSICGCDNASALMDEAELEKRGLLGTKREEAEPELSFAPAKPTTNTSTSGDSSTPATPSHDNNNANAITPTSAVPMDQAMQLRSPIVGTSTPNPPPTLPQTFSPSSLPSSPPPPLQIPTQTLQPPKPNAPPTEQQAAMSQIRKRNPSSNPSTPLGSIQNLSGSRAGLAERVIQEEELQRVQQQGSSSSSSPSSQPARQNTPAQVAPAAIPAPPPAASAAEIQTKLTMIDGILKLIVAVFALIILKRLLLLDDGDEF